MINLFGKTKTNVKNTIRSTHGIKLSNISVEHNTNKAQKVLNNQQNRLFSSQTNTRNHGKQPNNKKTLVKSIKSAFTNPKYQNRTLSENTVLKYGLSNKILSKLNNTGYNNNNFIKAILPENNNKYYNAGKNTSSNKKNKKKRFVKNMLHDVFYKFNNNVKNRMIKALQSNNSSNTTTPVNTNKYIQNLIRKYGDQMASGVNSNTMRFISTTPDLYSKIEKMKKQGATPNEIKRAETEINTILGLPVTTLTTKSYSI
jgi:hypothetical protein